MAGWPGEETSGLGKAEVASGLQPHAESAGSTLACVTHSWPLVHSVTGRGLTS